mgnify:CR=1 FL=1
MMANDLNTLSAWQWKLALIASHFQLGLISDDEIIAFLNYKFFKKKKF